MIYNSGRILSAIKNSKSLWFVGKECINRNDKSYTENNINPDGLKLYCTDKVDEIIENVLASKKDVVTYLQNISSSATWSDSDFGLHSIKIEDIFKFRDSHLFI